MELFFWVVGVVVVALILLIIVIMAGGGPRSELEKQIRQEQDFDPDDLYASDCRPARMAYADRERPSGIAIDRRRGEILLADMFMDLNRPPEERFVRRNRRFNASAVVGCEVLEDGLQIAYANRGSQAAGVLVGGALLGGVGALIGGLSGSRRTEDAVKKVMLRITVDDFDSPHHDIVLGDWSNIGTGISRHDNRYEEALRIAQLWHARITSFMRTEQRDRTAESSQPNSNGTIADLERLAELRERGVLDDDEFKLEKQRLLRKPDQNGV